MTTNKECEHDKGDFFLVELATGGKTSISKNASKFCPICTAPDSAKCKLCKGTRSVHEGEYPDYHAIECPECAPKVDSAKGDEVDAFRKKMKDIVKPKESGAEAMNVIEQFENELTDFGKFKRDGLCLYEENWIDLHEKFKSAIASAEAKSRKLAFEEAAKIASNMENEFWDDGQYQVTDSGNKIAEAIRSKSEEV